MKLGEGVEASIHCVALLAGLDEGRSLSAAALAEFHGVSPTYLLKHLKELVHAGILQSVPGPNGGYRMARAPERVSLIDIVLAVEGPQPAFRCAEIRRRGPGAPDATAYTKPCGINAAMLRAERAYRDALAAVSLAEVVADYAAEGDPRSIARGCAFVERNQRPQPE
jgi:Rrf2 family protein